MRFNVTIRPTVYTGQGTYESAMDRFRSVIPPCCCATYSGYGNYYRTFESIGYSGPAYAYCFNVNVFKRGKHRKNKHYALYVYKIDLKLLDILGMKIEQHQRYFRISPKKRK